MTALLVGAILGAALAALLRRDPPKPDEEEESVLLCPRCKQHLHDHAPNCRHSPTRRRP